jgi:hypothetical protein
MATSPNGVEWKLLGRITDSFYHNFAAVNKKIQARWAAILSVPMFCLQFPLLCEKAE